MKYDIDVEYRYGSDQDEEDALFVELRKTLRVHLDSISAIDDPLFTTRMTQLICRVFKPDFADIKWTDAELSLYMMYVYAESKPTKGTFRLKNIGTGVYVTESGSFTAMGMMMSSMLESGISQYPHPSIPAIYFETIIRYSQFFERRPEYIQPALQSFLDTRGLFHPVQSIRLRVNYLFLRFVKLLRSVLGPFVESILTVIQPLLVIKHRIMPKKEDPYQSSFFDSQIFLFEAVGYLISIDTITPARQADLLTIVMAPSLRRIEEITGYADTTPLDTVFITELGDLITAVGGITKGFPEFDPRAPASVWAAPFKTTLQGILIVLNKLNRFSSIREAVTSYF